MSRYNIERIKIRDTSTLSDVFDSIWGKASACIEKGKKVNSSVFGALKCRLKEVKQLLKNPEKQRSYFYNELKSWLTTGKESEVAYTAYNSLPTRQLREMIPKCLTESDMPIAELVKGLNAKAATTKLLRIAKARWLLETTKKLLAKDGVKLLGLGALFTAGFMASTMLDVAEAGTFVIPHPEWHYNLEKAYKEQNIPDNERISKKKFYELSEREQVVLLNKYGISVGVKPDKLD